MDTRFFSIYLIRHAIYSLLRNSHCLIKGGGIGSGLPFLTQVIERFTLPYMATEKEIQERIIKAINAKMDKKPTCPMCGYNIWTIASGYVVASASKHPTTVGTAKNVFPMVPMICSNCGNTQLFNLAILGFTPNDWDSLRFGEDG